MKDNNQTQRTHEGQSAPFAEQEVVAPQKNKRAWLGKLFLIAVLAFGVYALFGIGNEGVDGASFQQVFANVSPVWLGIWLGGVAAMVILEGFKFVFCSHIVLGKPYFGACFKTAILGRYYDCVTPFAVGGQPMQIYELHKHGMSGGNATGIVLMRYFAQMMVWTLFAVVFMVAGVSALDGVQHRTLLITIGWVGLAINLVMPLFIVSFAVFPKMTRKLAVGIVKLGKKMHLVKDEQATLQSAFKVVEDFVTCFRVATQKPLWSCGMVLCVLAEVAVSNALPFLIMKALSCDVDGMAFAIMTLNIYATQGVSFIPTPGGSGVAEYIGKLAFRMAAGATLAWSVLLLRLSVYYIYVVLGLVITAFDLLKKPLSRKK